MWARKYPQRSPSPTSCWKNVQVEQQLTHIFPCLFLLPSMHFCNMVQFPSVSLFFFTSSWALNFLIASLHAKAMSLFHSWVAHDCFHFLCTSFLCLSSAKSSSLTHAGLLPCLLDFLNIAIAGFAFWGGCLWTSTSCPVSPRLSRAVFHRAWQGDPWVSQKSAFLKSKLVTLLLLCLTGFLTPWSHGYCQEGCSSLYIFDQLFLGFEEAEHLPYSADHSYTSRNCLLIEHKPITLPTDSGAAEVSHGYNSLCLPNTLGHRNVFHFHQHCISVSTGNSTTISTFKGSSATTGSCLSLQHCYSTGGCTTYIISQEVQR